MTQSETESYRFAPQSLVQIRKSLGLSQAKMARTLGIPVNTLSRWEIGATVPSAASLAAIYSVSMEHGIAAQFFRKQRSEMPAAGTRSRLVVMWDFRAVGLSPEHVPFWWGLMKEYLAMRFRETTASWTLNAFTGPGQQAAEDRLENEGFRAWDDHGDIDDDLIAQCRSDCGRDPEATVLVLVAGDGDYSDLVEEMAGKGVDVYVWAPEEAGDNLRDAVDADHWIPWKEPYVVAAFLVLIDNLGGGQITRAQFGNECRKLVREQPYFDPTAIGFRRRNPYGALLDWLAEHGFVDMRSDRDNPNFISVVRRA